MICFRCESEEDVTKGVYADFCASCRAAIAAEQAQFIREQWVTMLANFVHQTHAPDHLHVGKECVSCRANLADLLRFSHRHNKIIFPEVTP